MIIILSIFFLIYYCYLILLLIFAFRRNQDKGSQLRFLPQVSVLVAARNEENNILSCLEALSKIDYPKENIEFWIGNDSSEDNTEKIILDFIKDKENFHLLNIKGQIGNAKGKANVLGQLVHKAKGDFFFITDADIEVPSSWINGLLRQYDDKDGIVSGVSIVDGPDIFAKLQGLEWIFAFGMVKTVSDLKIPVSAVGNNMMISRKAYESTGGYENIPFSVTEDYELFRQTLNKGWDFKNLMNKEVLAFSKPIHSLKNLFHQRKRWMSGAWNLPLILVVCLMSQAMFFPMILLALFLHPAWGGLLWMVKILLQHLLISVEMRRLKWPSLSLQYILIFEIYSGLLSLFLMIYYLIPTGIIWKGRKY